MNESGTEHILASKWDLPFLAFSLLRVAFGGLPFWVKAVLIGLVGCLGAWTAFTWLRDRGRRVT
ncbi:hypothetical protein ACF059_23105 [Streptomyces sp. NPDC016562]|uniref:hypothetical protein n=1 Tax=Streptomyces sp. NPDC016562 TaxID=3364966 RepID=UPI0036FD5C08